MHVFLNGTIFHFYLKRDKLKVVVNLNIQQRNIMVKLQLLAACFLVLLFVQSSLTLPVTTNASAANNDDKHTISSRHTRSIREYHHTCTYCWKIGKYELCKTLLENVNDCADKGGESSNSNKRR